MSSMEEGRICIVGQEHHIQRALATRPDSMHSAAHAIKAYARETGYTWQQRGQLVVACGA
jgi:hypothetical protein